jgi:uncharacterized protein (DUF169 family)
MDYSELQKRVDELIKPSGSPVGFKMLKKKKDAEKYKIIPLEHKLALCQALKYAGIYEKTRAISLDNIDNCVIGSKLLGFSELPKDLKKRWIEGFCYTPKNFDKMVNSAESLPMKEYGAMIMGPLKDFDSMNAKPDGVLMFVNSSQAYLLLASVFDSLGKKSCSCFNGHAACEIIPAVAKRKTPWLTIPCGGARSIAGSENDELWMGLSVEELIASMKRLTDAGLKYPPAINQSIISPLNKKHPLTGLIER